MGLLSSFVDHKLGSQGVFGVTDQGHGCLVFRGQMPWSQGVLGVREWGSGGLVLEIRNWGPRVYLGRQRAGSGCLVCSDIDRISESIWGGRD